MKEVKSSIAKKINSSWIRLLFVCFLLFDILFILVILGVWLYFRGQTLEMNAALLGTVLKYGILTMIIFQAGLIVYLAIAGYNRIRDSLRSIDTMTSSAAERVQQMELERFRMVEDAIGRISPLEPDERLYTGDEELKGLEDAINSLLQRMHESYRRQVRFVSDASHELRTPIAVIQGYANMLDRWGKEDETILEEGIQAIKSESETMKRLVEQLLFLARGDSGRQPIKKEAVNASELMKTVYEEFRMIDTEHEWGLDIPEELTVQADDAMLKQAIRILVENASKYTPVSGRIQLRVRRIDEENAAFEVTDQGIGIRKDDVEHVFERFYRADPARDRKTGGSGLGLSIADWIAKQHGGYLTVLSYEELGTRFTLVIPLIKES